MAYSTDLRERVLDAIERGMERSEAITIFAVSEGSIKRWQKLRREGSPLTPRRPGRKRKAAKPNDDAVVRRLVDATPDATLQEYADQWNELHEKALSRWTIGRRIRRLKLTRKKRV
jgi:transposase